MSVNFPVSGGNSSHERVTSSEAQPKVKEVATGKTSFDKGGPVPLSISTLTGLRQAEMRGDNYTISDEQVIKAIEKAIHAMQGKTTSLQFSIHERTKLITVKVIDASTGDIIREIPPEKTLDFVAKLWEMAGILIDEKR